MTGGLEAGFFITFEGPEGGGKSTQVARLKDALLESGYRVWTTREPGGTQAGEQLRQVLLGTSAPDLQPWAEALLFIAARAQLVAEVIRPRLAAGEVVISDRFADSTLAYQGWGRGLDRELLGRLLREATQGLTPALSFLLDLPVERGLGRIPRPSLDRLDREAGSFHRRVRDGYHRMVEAEPGRWVVLEAEQEPDALAAAIRSATLDRLQQAGVRPAPRRSA